MIHPDSIFMLRALLNRILLEDNLLINYNTCCHLIKRLEENYSNKWTAQKVQETAEEGGQIFIATLPYTTIFDVNDETGR